MNNIIKKGLGKLQSLITKGYGKILVIIIEDITSLKNGAITSPSKFWDFSKRYIRTRSIYIKKDKKEIYCDVIFLNKNDVGYMKEAILLNKKYKEVIVYDINEVEIK